MKNIVVVCPDAEFKIRASALNKQFVNMNTIATTSSFKYVKAIEDIIDKDDNNNRGSVRYLLSTYKREILDRMDTREIRYIILIPNDYTVFINKIDYRNNAERAKTIAKFNYDDYMRNVYDRYAPKIKTEFDLYESLMAYGTSSSDKISLIEQLFNKFYNI